MSEPIRPLVPQPCTLVIFGGSGDLARRKPIPAVYNLVLDGVLPPNYAILGNARKPLSDADFREIAREPFVKYSRQKISEKVWPDFERRLFYVAGSIEDPKAYENLRKRLEQIEADLKLPGNRIFYLAIPPTSIADVVEGLRDAGLVQPPSSAGPFSRVIVENHIPQPLCLVAMEPPHSLDPDVVRNARMEVLRCLRPITGKDVEKYTVRAQYGPGKVKGEDVPGYRREPGVKPDSTIETYVAIKLFVENWRWSGGPWYLRTGKGLAKRASEIAVFFKPIPQILFNANPEAPLDPNILVMKIQPEEGLTLRIICKVPGTKAKTNPVELHFQYGEAFAVPSPEAYERLLLDVMAGDASLFMRRDAVEASWAWITGILEGWKTYGTKWLPEYPVGSWGPVEANRLIESEGRRWRTL